MWAVVENAVNCALSLFLIGLLGFVLARKGWFSDDFKNLAPRLVTVVAMPLYLFKNIVGAFDRKELGALIGGVAVPAVSILLTFAVGWLLAKFVRMPRARAGVFSATFPTGNTIFIGLPVNVALFGEAALPYVLLYFFANTVFFWTVGNYQFSLGGDQAPEKFISRSTFKRLFRSPPLAGFALGILAVLTDLRPPRFFMEAAGQIGALTTPLALLFIGISLAANDLRTLALDRDVKLLLLGRFVVSPLAVLASMSLFSIPPLMAKVFIIQASLPAAATATLLAAYYKSDAAFASAIVSLTTLLSLATIPFYMVLIAYLF